MELELDVPNYLYDKPDDYYAEDIIKNRDETIEGLKNDSKILKDRLKYFSQFRPLDTQIHLFGGDTSLKGEIKFVPKKFSVVSNMGRIYKALTCDVILKNVRISDGDFHKIFMDPKLKDFAEVFKKNIKGNRGKWERKFDNISKLIGMEDYSLRINDIIFEFDE